VVRIPPLQQFKLKNGINVKNRSIYYSLVKILSLYSLYMKRNKILFIHPNQYAAFDQNMLVFAGYKDGYPLWSNDANEFKYINDTSHPKALRDWFPEKQIELIKI